MILFVSNFKSNSTCLVSITLPFSLKLYLLAEDLIRTVPQLLAAQRKAYLGAGVAVLLSVLLAFIVAQAIPYGKGRRSKANLYRRIWFLMIGLVPPIGYFLYLFFFFISKIKKRYWQHEFTNTAFYSVLFIFLGYFLLSYFLGRTLKNSKFGEIFKF
ncbi:hypothetical protein [Hugenholtzia roseola]|uniref:hypothetical protein n=1 Tax=Hugenholtzia roseola TaxID=1002 RepID=UPI0003FBF652|nr:hypothetical protein [Hugenholtzia roseola]